MNIRKNFRRYCALILIMAFTSTHLAAQQTLSQFRPAPASQGQAAGGDAGAIHLAAAIGIVKPKPGSGEESEAAGPTEPPAPQAPQAGAVEPAVEEVAQTSAKGVSKLAIGVGVGLAALLAAVAGGGGGGNSTTPSHSTP